MFRHFDFTGTAPARDDNLNATEAIVHSAVCYCLRVLIGSNLPLNEGLLEPVSLILPTDSLLNPAFSSDASQSPGVAGAMWRSVNTWLTLSSTPFFRKLPVLREP